MAGATVKIDVNQQADRSIYFQNVVERMLTYWRDHDAIKTIDVAVLDRERNRILKNIALGLDLQPLWPLVKKLVIAFAPYMERRGFWDIWHGMLEETIRMAQGADDVDAETTLTAFLARLCQRMSRPQDVVRHYKRVIKLARQYGNQFEEARACSNLGYLYIEGGHWWRSEVLSQHALEIFEKLGSEHGQAHTHNHFGVLHLKQGRYEEAEAQYEMARSLWHKAHDLHSLIHVHLNLGALNLEQQKTQSALKNLQSAYDAALITGEKSVVPKILNNMSAVYRERKEWTKAMQYALKAEAGFREFADERGLADAWQSLGVISMHTAQEPIAIQYLTESLAMRCKLADGAGKTALLRVIIKLTALSRDDSTISSLHNLVIDRC